MNISGRHLLSGQLIENVTDAFEGQLRAARQLILELTETVLLTHLLTVALEMQRLRSLGIRMAIDDFGTGHTSLADLQHLTVDEIKIDRSFVQQLPDGRESSLMRMVTEVSGTRHRRTARNAHRGRLLRRLALAVRDRLAYALLPLVAGAVVT
ncbi:MAG: EAL domain-containing protein [Solirubrobacteraceae bacterium]